MGRLSRACDCVPNKMSMKSTSLSSLCALVPQQLITLPASFLLSFVFQQWQQKARINQHDSHQQGFRQAVSRCFLIKNLKWPTSQSEPQQITSQITHVPLDYHGTNSTTVPGLDTRQVAFSDESECSIYGLIAVSPAEQTIHQLQLQMMQTTLEQTLLFSWPQWYDYSVFEYFEFGPSIKRHHPRWSRKVGL